MFYNETVFRLDSVIRSIYIFGKENLRKTYEQFPLFNTEGCVGISYEIGGLIQKMKKNMTF